MTLTSRWCRPRFTRLEETKKSSPSSPRVEHLLDARAPAGCRGTCGRTSARGRLARRAGPAGRPRSVEGASGFSTKTCLPARARASARSKWVKTGVAIDDRVDARRPRAGRRSVGRRRGAPGSGEPSASEALLVEVADPLDLDVRRARPARAAGSGPSSRAPRARRVSDAILVPVRCPWCEPSSTSPAVPPVNSLTDAATWAMSSAVMPGCVGREHRRARELARRPGSRPARSRAPCRPGRGASAPGSGPRSRCCALPGARAARRGPPDARRTGGRPPPRARASPAAPHGDVRQRVGQLGGHGATARVDLVQPRGA